MTKSEKMNLDLIEEGVPTYWGSNECDVINSSLCSNTKYSDAFFTGKALKGVLLSLKHCSASKSGINKTNLNTSFFAGNFSTKRQKAASSVGYEVMAVFGDLMDPPKCFAMLPKDNATMSYMFSECKSTIAVGRVYYVYEPAKSDSYLGHKTPIINSEFPIIPLKYSIPSRSLDKQLVESPLILPKNAEERLYFIKHHCPVDIGRFTVVTKNVSCGGMLCDRAYPSSKNVECGCTYKVETQPAVAEYTVTIKVPANISKKQQQDIVNVRSLRTSDFFFEDLKTFGEQPLKVIQDRFFEVRKSVSRMVDFVNNNGGWTLVGWFKKGMVKNASNESEQVISEETNLHLSLLIPTDPEIANKRSDAVHSYLIPIDAPEPIAVETTTGTGGGGASAGTEEGTEEGAMGSAHGD